MGQRIKNIAREPVRALLQFFFRCFHQLEVHGLRNIPRTGPFVLISNHGSYYDPVMIRGVLRRRVCFMAWKAIFSWPVVRRLARWGGAFPVDVEKRLDLDAFHTALAILKAGDAVGIFPEGGREPGPFMGPVKLGAIQIALRAGAPIVPVSIIGVHDIWPRRRRSPQPGRIAVTFHPPVPMPREPLANWREERRFLEQVMEKVREVINAEIAERLRKFESRGCIGESLRHFQLTAPK
jgi:1-acyl-sn-glycerol-3-phosphate acyltransferase